MTKNIPGASPGVSTEASGNSTNVTFWNRVTHGMEDNEILELIADNVWESDVV